MKKLKDISSDASNLKDIIEEISSELKRLYNNLKMAEDEAENIEYDIDEIISAEEDTFLNEKVWEKNNLDKHEFISSMLEIAKEVYDNLPNDENFDFKIKISERRVKYWTSRLSIRSISTDIK